MRPRQQVQAERMLSMDAVHTQEYSEYEAQVAGAGSENAQYDCSTYRTQEYSGYEAQVAGAGGEYAKYRCTAYLGVFQV